MERYRRQIVGLLKVIFSPRNNGLVRLIVRLDRINFIFLLFVLYGLFIIATTFKYSVMEYRYFSKLADGQQTRVVKNSVNR